jgi:osmoprotectant transport system ATP-binding protein
MIYANKLTRRFGDFTAVSEVSFSVNEGETLVLIGPSGCGKTTTLKMLNRLILPSSGNVEIEGVAADSLSLEALRRRMGYVIQNVGLFPHYTVAENIAVVPRLLKWEEKKIKQRVGALLEQLGLPPGPNADKYPHQLSGGQQQRVGIARALAAHPPILLMDEPFGALDPLTRQQIRSDFMELEALQATTIVMVTHDIEEAFEMASTICLLDKGHIQQLDTPEKLLLEPANDFVRAFIAEQSERLHLRAVKLKDIFSRLPAVQPNEEKVLPLQPSAALLHAIYRLGKASQKYAVVEMNGQQRFATLDDFIRIFKQTLGQWNQ